MDKPTTDVGFAIELLRTDSRVHSAFPSEREQVELAISRLTEYDALEAQLTNDSELLTQEIIKNQDLKAEVEDRERDYGEALKLANYYEERAEKAEAELALAKPLLMSKEEQALNRIAEEPHTHPELPNTDEEWEAERNCRHCLAAHALEYAWEEIRDTFHRLEHAAKSPQDEEKGEKQ